MRAKSYAPSRVNSWGLCHFIVFFKGFPARAPRAGRSPVVPLRLPNRKESDEPQTAMRMISGDFGREGIAALRRRMRPIASNLRLRSLGHLSAARKRKCSKASRGFEPRSLDSESRVLTVTPRGRLFRPAAEGLRGPWPTRAPTSRNVRLSSFALGVARGGSPSPLFRHWTVGRPRFVVLCPRRCATRSQRLPLGRATALFLIGLRPQGGQRAVRPHRRFVACAANRRAPPPRGRWQFRRLAFEGRVAGWRQAADKARPAAHQGDPPQRKRPRTISYFFLFLRCFFFFARARKRAPTKRAVALPQAEATHNRKRLQIGLPLPRPA